MKIQLVTLGFLLLFFLHPQTKISAQNADIIITNGKIFTSNEDALYVQALAIKGNTIIASGTNEAILELADSKTKKIDVQGKTIVPGFNDAHDHPGWEAPVGKSYTYTEMNPAGPSKKSVLDSVALLVKLARPGEWISGFIGTDVFFDTSMRKALDSIAPNNPVRLQVRWGHGMVVNNKTLQTVELTDDAKDPLGGWYIRNTENKISALQQNAQTPVWLALNASEPDNLIKGLRLFSNEQLLAGITTTQYIGTGLNAAMAGTIFREANLQQRIRIIAWPRSTPEGRQLSDWKTNKNQPTPLTTLSGVKYLIDGSPMEGNALRKKAYHERGNGNGRLNYPLDTLKQIYKEALSSDTQLLMHMTADSSFSVVLNLMQEVAGADQWKTKRVRFEHNCVGEISQEQQKILKDFGIVIMHTPKYCQGSPLKSLIDSGVLVGIAPDGTTNPFYDIMVVTTQQSNPKENISVEQAVISYTRNNAYAEFADKTKGMLKKGMLADLAVLSQDIFTIPVEQIPATKSILTMVDGKIVYEENNY